ncbi:hypothetical protein EVAR_97688_1 [Eumeta japonica]|uniref:Uncharacterized protein n=1 Tax=Eumeta variegata TaxID=151549 RepID=A0A4C1X0U6_EUMVA|nr:hypothetical protein EVAR_97688_1 [Eumeta japonica]
MQRLPKTLTHTQAFPKSLTTNYEKFSDDDDDRNLLLRNLPENHSLHAIWVNDEHPASPERSDGPLPAAGDVRSRNAYGIAPSCIMMHKGKKCTATAVEDGCLKLRTHLCTPAGFHIYYTSFDQGKNYFVTKDRHVRARVHLFTAPKQRGRRHGYRNDNASDVPSGLLNRFLR